MCVCARGQLRCWAQIGHKSEHGVQLFVRVPPVPLSSVNLALREEHRLRNTLGTKREEVTGEWRRLHNEELKYVLMKYCSAHQIKYEMGMESSLYGKEEICIQGFGGGS